MDVLACKRSHQFTFSIFFSAFIHLHAEQLFYVNGTRVKQKKNLAHIHIHCAQNTHFVYWGIFMAIGVKSQHESVQCTIINQYWLCWIYIQCNLIQQTTFTHFTMHLNRMCIIYDWTQLKSKTMTGKINVLQLD